MEAKTLSFDLKTEAQRVFDSMLLEEPLNFLALYGKSLTLYKEGKMQECIEMMSKAVELEPIGSESNVKDMKETILKLINSRETPFTGQKKSITMIHPIVTGKITQITLTQPKENCHSCKVCSKDFTKQFSLNRHMLLHTGEKPHKCKYCAKAFIQKTDMERHETTHSDNLDFACNVCDRRFRTKKNLSCHSITHSSERPFKCRFCEKDFKVLRLLRFHEGLHKEEKPFNCDICGKGFPAKAYIKSHMMTHNNNKPFSCVVCHLAFKRNYDLNFHMRNQHKQFPIHDNTFKQEQIK